MPYSDKAAWMLEFLIILRPARKGSDTGLRADANGRLLLLDCSTGVRCLVVVEWRAEPAALVVQYGDVRDSYDLNWVEEGPHACELL